MQRSVMRHSRHHGISLTSGRSCSPGPSGLLSVAETSTGCPVLWIQTWGSPAERGWRSQMEPELVDTLTQDWELHTSLALAFASSAALGFSPTFSGLECPYL